LIACLIASCFQYAKVIIRCIGFDTRTWFSCPKCSPGHLTLLWIFEQDDQQRRAMILREAEYEVYDHEEDEEVSAGAASLAWKPSRVTVTAPA
jgi:hypothetical protein